MLNWLAPAPGDPHLKTKAYTSPDTAEAVSVIVLTLLLVGLGLTVFVVLLLALLLLLLLVLLFATPLVLVAVPALVPLVASEAGSLVLCANALELSLPLEEAVGVEEDNCDEDGDGDEGEEGFSAALTVIETVPCITFCIIIINDFKFKLVLPTKS